MKKRLDLKIGNLKVGYGRPVFVIAEAGVNHNGRLDLALKLVEAAAASGADAVKFQTFKAEQVVTLAGKMADYQKKNIGREDSQIKMLRALELQEEFYAPLMRRAKELGIIFLSTPHGGIASVDLLQSLELPAFKFGSGDLTNLPLLAYAAKFKKPMILGTGMATMAEVKEAASTIRHAGNDKIVMLHCTTNYPCPSEEVNLRAMQTMMKELPAVLVGYSDHTQGAQVPVMAVTLGACVIEKHFTLDKTMEGPDHVASMEPAELAEMMRQIRAVETIMGSAVKKPMPSELKIAPIARKSLVAAADIKRGEKFTLKNIGIKRPGTGLAPAKLRSVLGKIAKRDFPYDSQISL